MRVTYIFKKCTYLGLILLIGTNVLSLPTALAHDSVQVAKKKNNQSSHTKLFTIALPITFIVVAGVAYKFLKKDKPDDGQGNGRIIQDFTKPNTQQNTSPTLDPTNPSYQPGLDNIEGLTSQSGEGMPPLSDNANIQRNRLRNLDPTKSPSEQSLESIPDTTSQSHENMPPLPDNTNIPPNQPNILDPIKPPSQPISDNIQNLESQQNDYIIIWQCSSCKKKNDSNAKWCSCSAYRSNEEDIYVPKQSQSLKQHSSNVMPQNNQGTWRCPTCGYRNNTKRLCSLCRTECPNPNHSMNVNPQIRDYGVQQQKNQPQQSQPNVPLNNNNVQNLHRNNSKTRKWPKEDNKVTLSSTNQYQKGGSAACLHAASKLLKKHLQNPQKDLYDTNLLNQVCEEGANMLQGNMADEFYDIFTKHKNTYNFTLVSTGELDIIPMGGGNDIKQPKLLKHKNDFEKEIRTGTQLGYTTALVKNGPEGWALVVHPDKTISIFDSHGRPDTGSLAYIKHFDEVDKLTEYIWKSNALLNGNLDDMLDWQKAAYNLYIYWVVEG